MIRRWVRLLGALLRVGFAEAIAYRAEFLVWMLTTTMPLVSMALWTAVAHEGPFRSFGKEEFVAYYLGAFIVRTLTGSWVVWQMNQEIRSGALSLRLLRPIHPFVAYTAQHLAAIPLRSVLAIPVAAILLFATNGTRLPSDPVQAALVPVALAGAWTLTFVIMLLIGSLGLFVERSIAIFEIWLAAFSVLSGYLVPLPLLPDWVSTAARWLPFRYLLGFPVELMTGMSTRGEAIFGVAMQGGFTAVLIVVTHYVWNAGVKRFEAFGA